ncbi:hypothetical protein D3C85_1614560 [compost metagenome]
MKVISASTAKEDLVTGTSTVQRIRIWDAPSTSPASTSSCDTCRKACLIRKIAKTLTQLERIRPP